MAFIGKKDRNYRTAALARLEFSFTLAHHFEPLPDTVQRDMRFVVVGGDKVRVVVLDDDLASAVRLTGLDINMKRIAFSVSEKIASFGKTA